MKQTTNSKVLVWATGLLLALLVTVGGVTFAALQSQPGLLRGNVIQTAVASLQVSPDGTTYGSVMDGYAFSNLIPGGLPTPNNGYPIYVKNIGTTPLALRLSVSSAVNNPNAVDLTKVHVILAPTGGGAAQNVTLQDLITAQSSGGLAVNQAPHLNPSEVTSFLVKVSLDNDAVTGPSAVLSNIDFNFGALAVN